MELQNNPPRILRRREVQERTGLSKPSIYREIKRGEFPRPLKLGPRSGGWRSDEISDWIEGRERA